MASVVLLHSFEHWAHPANRLSALPGGGAAHATPGLPSSAPALLFALLPTCDDALVEIDRTLCQNRWAIPFLTFQDGLAAEALSQQRLLQQLAQFIGQVLRVAGPAHQAGLAILDDFR